MENETNDRKKHRSWATDRPEYIASELKSRRLYGETRGTRFESDTLVVRKGLCAVVADPPPHEHHKLAHKEEPKRSLQSTMGLFSSTLGNSSHNSSHKGSRPTGGKSSIFDKLWRDAEAGRNGSNGQSSASSPGGASWVKCMNGNVPDDKRAALERQLKRLQQMSNTANAQQTPHVQSVQPMQPLGAVDILKPDGAVGCACQNGVPGSEGNGLPVVQQAVGFNRELFNSIRTRIGNLLLQELPPEVTAELRQIGRELEEVGQTLT